MGKDSSHPYAGNPRKFAAAAMPNGDARFGVEGPLVFLSEQRGGCVDRPKILTKAEAEQLRDQLDSALRAFGMAESMAEGFAARPASGPYPFRDHRTLADLEADNAV
ncbi:hypothetical protein J3454_14280 [Erythrobacter sp. NFXS35]|uniref:hypothetical protein n=1 Tax=Erythrobacter sp. NFXS35 TaxID=2818436 RepID=UPI0032E04BA9